MNSNIFSFDLFFPFSSNFKNLFLIFFLLPSNTLSIYLDFFPLLSFFLLAFPLLIGGASKQARPSPSSLLERINPFARQSGRTCRRWRGGPFNPEKLPGCRSGGNQSEDEREEPRFELRARLVRNVFGFFEDFFSPCGFYSLKSKL